MWSNLRSLTRLSTRGISLLSSKNKKFEINDNNEFVQKVLNSEVPVIVNFHADWCDPCKILTSKLEEIIGPMEHLNLATIDVESNPEMIHTFEVKAVPAVLVITNGLVVDKFIGLVDAKAIDNLIKKLTVRTRSSETNKSEGGVNEKNISNSTKT